MSRYRWNYSRGRLIKPGNFWWSNKLSLGKTFRKKRQKKDKNMKKTDKFWKKFEDLAYGIEKGIRIRAAVLTDEVMNTFTKESEKLLKEIGGKMVEGLEEDFRKRLDEYTDTRFENFHKKYKELLDKL